MKRAKDAAMLDRLQKWASDPEKYSKLNPEDSKIFERWSTADDLLRRYPSRKYCVSMMVAKYGCDQATAYRDIANAQVFFGTVNVYNKDYIKGWLIEDILKLIQTAKEKGDTKARSAAQANLIKVMGFDREDKSVIRPEDLEAHKYYAVLISGKDAIKIDLEKLDDIPMETRAKIVASIDDMITEDTAYTLISSAMYEQELQSEQESDQVDSPESEG